MSAAKAWVVHCAESPGHFNLGYRYEAKCTFQRMYETMAPVNKSSAEPGHYDPTVLRYIDPAGLSLHDGMYSISNVFLIEQNIGFVNAVGHLVDSGWEIVQTLVLDSGMHISYLEVRLYTWVA
jgi:hypothetical protein